MPATLYRGRFAPSPTGPLHFGSLIAAMGSYLEAKSRAGEWLVRMEDLDPPRCMPDTDQRIINTLAAYGFEWDGEIVWQSQRFDLYAEALEQLRTKHLVYRCDCSRKAIIQRCSQGLYGAIYDGHCRHLEQDDGASRIIASGTSSYADRLQGHIQQNLAQDIGDFHLLRRDGFYAYHIGVVVDDALQGISDIVRGFDLLDSTPRQIYLQQQLNYPTPSYAHLPLAIKPDGQKLSKQNLATALDDNKPVPAIWEALQFLGQRPPRELQIASLNEIWAWALQHWCLQRVPAAQGIETHIL